MKMREEQSIKTGSCTVGLPFSGKHVIYFLCSDLRSILLFFQGTTRVNSQPFIIIFIPIVYYRGMIFHSVLNYNRICCVWLSELSGSLRLFYLAYHGSQQQETICYVTFATQKEVHVNFSSKKLFGGSPQRLLDSTNNSTETFFI